MNIKAIMCDLDGTLLNSKGMVDNETIQAIKKVREKGIYFGICTGRDTKSVKDLLDEWKLTGLVDGIVGNGGGEVFDYKLNKYEMNYPLNGSLINEIIDHFKDMDINFAIPKNGILYSFKEDRHIKLLSKYDMIPYEIVDKDEFLKDDQLKLIIVCDEDYMKNVIEKAKTFSNSKYKSASLKTASILYEYMDYRLNKSEGLKKILSFNNLTLDDLCVFGDADNDYDMVKNAKVGVVMANGSEKTKSVADYITDDNDNNGIANFINKYILC